MGKKKSESTKDGVIKETPKKSSKSEPWEREVYVGGLPFSWTDDDIVNFFEQKVGAGKVEEVRAPKWQDTGRLRGSAHVRFASVALRDTALELNHATPEGERRYVTVSAANAPAQQSSAGSTEPTSTTLFVKGLPYTATEAEIAEAFERIGAAVEKVRIVTNPQTRQSKGFCYLECKSIKSALTAWTSAQKTPVVLGGRTLFVDGGTGQARAGFHYRKESYDSGYGPAAKQR